MSELLTPKKVTKRHARRGAKPSKPSKPSIQRAGLRAATVHAIQVDVVSSVRAQANALLDKVVKTQDAALTTLREKMLTHYGTCVALETEIKRTPYGASSSSLPAPRASSSSGAASSSSSDASSSSAPQEVNPVTRAQQILREIEALHKDWSRRHTLFQAARLKEANKAHFLAFAENPGSIFTLPESMNVRYLFGHEKTKPAASASLVSSSSSSYASSSSAASSSSSVSSAPRVIWRFATRHVTKQRESLIRMPAYIKDKIDLFVSEIEADPLQQRLRSGRLKSLVGAPNTFSRRVDQGNRFVYQIEETAPGKFNATILSFLDHYKNLDFSKQF
jgi:Txe/YoeB family toxin of Txe-Axe toxin-antitoxin module